MSERAWIVTDGAVGNERQAEALAAAMRLDPRVFRLALPAPWSWFAPRRFVGWERALPTPLRDAAANEPPRIAIGCGRASALATGWVRERHGAYAVQILDPRIARERWNLIVAPVHDRVPGDNVLATIGALNAVTPARLAAAALGRPEFVQLPAPRTAVLVGGSTRAQRIGGAYARTLARRLRGWHARDGGSLLITTSRRTPAVVRSELLAAVAGLPVAMWSPGDASENPYLAFLAHAQRIVVTPDSVNLLSEACATGKPVFTFAPRPVQGKLAAFHRELRDSGRIRDVGKEPATWAPEPLRETEGIAAEVLRRFEAWRRTHP
jgi:mitochondrial fission protein ELM1